MPTPEIVLRTAAVLAMLALAALVLAARRQDHTPWLGALAACAVAAFVVSSAPGAAARLGAWDVPVTLLCVAKAVFFLLFARGLFAETFKLQPRHLALIGVTVAYGGWQQLVFAPGNAMGMSSPWERLVAGGFELWVLALVVLALGEAWRGLAVDLVERRRRLRVLVVAGAAAFLAAAVAVQGYNVLQGTRTPWPVVMANLALITATGLAAIFTLVQLRGASWLDPEPAQARPDVLGAVERGILKALQLQVEVQHVYREEGLTIGALAARLRTREQLLRRVINQGLGYRNFNDFLHACRIREACERLRRAEDAGRPVLSIALEVGYGSIGPFNRAFKSRIGMTPTRFRQAGQAATGP